MNIQNNSRINTIISQPNNQTIRTFNNLNFSNFLKIQSTSLDEKLGFNIQSLNLDEDINQTQSDSPCDCGDKLCEYGSDKDTKQLSEFEENTQGPSSCFDCPVRDECRHHVNGGFDIAALNSRFMSPNMDLDKKSSVQNNSDILVIAKAKLDYDYTNAYFYMKNKIRNINI